jgi:hypothetical protein
MQPVVTVKHLERRKKARRGGGGADPGHEEYRRLPAPGPSPVP